MNIGTNQVERMVEALTNTGRRTGYVRNTGLVKTLMKAKTEDAKKDVKILEHQYHRARSNLWRTIPYHSRQAYAADKLIKEEMDNRYKEDRAKMNRKIQHLQHRYISKIPETIEGIRITDAAIGPKKPLPNPVIVNVEVSENAQQLLQLPPKTATYKPISTIECETEIEKMIVKLKWEKRSDKERQEAGDTKEEWEGSVESLFYIMHAIPPINGVQYFRI